MDYIDIIKYTVESIQVDGLPRFLCGHPKDINDQLTQMSRDYNKPNKFPAVCLILDTRKSNNSRIGISATVNYHILIVNDTLPNYNSLQRREHNFIPILRPIRERFIKALVKSKAVNNKDILRLEFSEVERYYWGKEGVGGVEANVFNDKLDAIELFDLKIDLKSNC